MPRTHRLLLWVLGFSIFCSAEASAHRLEPISTEFAAPFGPQEGSLEVT